MAGIAIRTAALLGCQVQRHALKLACYGCSAKTEIENRLFFFSPPDFFGYALQCFCIEVLSPFHWCDSHM